MAYKFIKHKRLNEDNAPAAAPQPGTAPAQGAQPNQTQPANNAQPAANGQQPQQGQNPQQNPQQGPDLNAAVTNANKFIGDVFTAIQQQIVQNMAKSCPELDTIAKDQNTPFKEEVGKMKTSYDAFTKAKADPAKPETTAQVITAFSTFIGDFTALVKKISDSAGQAQQQNGQQPQQPAPGAAANPQNASKEYTGFGQLLAENMEMNRYMTAIGQRWK